MARAGHASRGCSSCANPTFYGEFVLAGTPDVWFATLFVAQIVLFSRLDLAATTHTRLGWAAGVGLLGGLAYLGAVQRDALSGRRGCSSSDASKTLGSGRDDLDRALAHWRCPSSWIPGVISTVRSSRSIPSGMCWTASGRILSSPGSTIRSPNVGRGIARASMPGVAQVREESVLRRAATGLASVAARSSAAACAHRTGGASR